jgi:hypothetical protein
MAAIIESHGRIRNTWHRKIETDAGGKKVTNSALANSV